MKGHILPSLLAIALAACHTGAPRVATIVPLFGPVGRDTISGRVEEGDGVLLMMGGTALARIDMRARTRSDTPLLLRAGEPCWGLARLADGSLWTLRGRNTLARIDRDGRIADEHSLEEAHIGLFSAQGRLILQRASLRPGAHALYVATPGGSEVAPWSDMTVRPFDDLASGAAAALNLVSCGTSERPATPCWFPDEPAVSMIAASGETRKITLAGLPRALPADLINVKQPRLPIRDAFVERDGTMWILSTGFPPAARATSQGGWLLLRYGPRGELIDRRVLPEAVRVILRARSGRAIVLTGSGMVAEVLP